MTFLLKNRAVRSGRQHARRIVQRSTAHTMHHFWIVTPADISFYHHTSWFCYFLWLCLLTWLYCSLCMAICRSQPMDQPSADRKQTTHPMTAFSKPITSGIDEFPLYCEGVDRGRFAYAIYLLNKVMHCSLHALVLVMQVLNSLDISERSNCTAASAKHCLRAVRCMQQQMPLQTQVMAPLMLHVIGYQAPAT